MKRFCGLAVAAVAALLVLDNQARAQVGPASRPTPSSRPPVSPYLDLTRRGDPGLNYYRRVLPELQLRAADAQQAGAIGQLDRRLSKTEQATSNLPGTG